MKKFIFIPLAVLFFCTNSLTAQKEYDVIRNNWIQFSDAPNALYKHFAGQAYAFLQEREAAIEKITTLEEWQDRQKLIKKTLSDVVGAFPERTPLNARVMRTVTKSDYKIEHIVYESVPGFLVTSSLFIPRQKTKKKLPAVIFCSGHAGIGYRTAGYQHPVLSLVKKGFIVFAFDPVGQGERLQYQDTVAGKPVIKGPVPEHSYPGAQALISGDSQARYMIWDGIRAVDYLLTRKEVDPDNIGITGRSGGGTQTAYIAAFDERIKAAAPECYLTNFTRLIQNIGPQDAEQNFTAGIFHGLDEADLLLVRAPKPALMITTSRDIFNIEGAKESEREVARIYQAYGKSDSFG
ncbi:MAG: acetylxylan esterase, partial [Chitinophagaceae bacterium]|nr:acetylxylan esterase [Chitinophagaceae bacterium]